MLMMFDDIGFGIQNAFSVFSFQFSVFSFTLLGGVK